MRVLRKLLRQKFDDFTGFYVGSDGAASNNTEPFLQLDFDPTATVVAVAWFEGQKVIENQAEFEQQLQSELARGPLRG